MSTVQIEKLNPFTQELLYTQSETTVPELISVIQKANQSFADWKDSSIADRLTLLDKVTQSYKNKMQELAEAEALDQGLPLAFTLKANLEIGLKYLSQFKNELESVAQDKFYFPTGVSLVILSWNLSNRLFIKSAIASVLAGNSVIVKLSSKSLAIKKIWEAIFQEAGLPENLIQFVVIKNESLKKILVGHPAIKAVTVYGSLKTCSAIWKQISELSFQQAKKISLFSGAKNSAISLLEPNEDLARTVLDSFFIGGGQLHWNSSRLFFLEKYEQKWTELLNDYLKNLKPSQGIKDSSALTPLLSPSQLNSLKDQVVTDQGKVISLDDKAMWTYHLSNCSVLQQDELSQPLYILFPVKYPFDIPKHVNNGYYGAEASIWGEVNKDNKVVKQLDVGLISVNQWSVYSEVMSKSVKQSGLGSQDYRIFGEFHSNVKILS